MPRKSAKQVKSEIEKIRSFKWEFLRRNKEYQKDYDYFKKEDTEFYMNNPDATDEDYDKWLDDQYEDFYKKWYIDYMCDYKESKPKPFPEITIDEAPVMVCNRVIKCRMGDMLLLDHGKEVRLPQSLGLCINLSHPQGRIEALFKKILEESLEKRRMKLKDHDRRDRVNLYADYLKVWENRNKYKNKSWCWLANKLLPNKSNNYADGYPASHALMERYKECEKLIRRDYVNIQ